MLTRSVAATAIFSISMICFATMSQAGVDCTDPKFATHQQCADTGGGGAGGGSSGQGLDILADLVSGPTLMPDGQGTYVHNENGVKAGTGGETQPNRPGIFIDLRGTGKNPRTITINATCSNPIAMDPLTSQLYMIGNCSELASDIFDLERAELKLQVRPYEVNCSPDLLVNGQCPDVFTQGENVAQMSFRVVYYEQIILEIASDIGGPDSPNPGRCLSILSEEERRAYLHEFCSTLSNCNVAVSPVAMDADGRNNAWDIEALNDTGLICSTLSGDIKIIGVATNISFVTEVDEK